MTMRSVFRLMMQGRDAQRLEASPVEQVDLNEIAGRIVQQAADPTPMSRPKLHHTPQERHYPIVFELTGSCFVFGCECGVSGPFRGSHAEAQQDADQHPTPSI